MQPTLTADGNVIATDGGVFPVAHTTALGTWVKKGLDQRGFDRYDASFLWFQGAPDPKDPRLTCCFAGSVRTRFVTYFDKNNPDIMGGFIQPYLFPYVDPLGKVILANGFPSPDPLAGKLPETCTPQNGCLATFHFIIKRIFVD